MSDVHVSGHDVTKSFQHRDVLQGISFEVRPGDVVGVLGKNGAGKTTLLELMLGFTRPTQGSVRIFGFESFDLPAAAKSRIGFVPQQDELVDHLSVAGQLNVIGSFYPNWDEALIAELCEAWEIDVSQRVGKMSVGQRQKLSILLALGHRPDLVILDEPVASLDPLARRQFLEQIVEVAADGQRSVIFSSHIVSDIERLANRIWILKDGRMCWNGELDSLKQSIVRLHLRGVRDDIRMPLEGVLTSRRDGSYLTAVVRDWDDAAIVQLAERTATQIEAEPLNLEDIFLELHR